MKETIERAAEVQQIVADVFKGLASYGYHVVKIPKCWEGALDEMTAEMVADPRTLEYMLEEL